MVITFLSDYGLDDDFVGTCHGVIKGIAPGADIIDITHGISPRNVLEGALVLADTVPYMPVGVHLAVVDPGVGGRRRGVALRDGEGRSYVGPDNGLLVLAAERGGRIVAAHELANPRYALEPVSRTFHGRDVFAPAAAHLANGVPLGELGAAVDADSLVRPRLPLAEMDATGIRATALYVDRFGNIQLNVERAHLEDGGMAVGTPVEIELDGRRVTAVVAETFVDVPAGELLVYEDSYRRVAIAVNEGSAAEKLAARPGHRVRIRRKSA